MKRKIAFILALIMVLCVALSACGDTSKPAKDPVTKESLLVGYKTRTEQTNGGSYTMSMDAKIAMTLMGQAQDMEMTAEMKVESNKDSAHISGTTSTAVAGQSEKVGMDIYSIKSGDGFDVYTNTDGTWYKSHANVNVDGNVQSVLSMQDVSTMEMTETEKEYVVEGKVALAEVFNALKNYMGSFDGLEGLGFDPDSLDLKNVDPAKVTYHFDKNTQEPTGVDIDMSGCMNSLMEELLKTASGLGNQIGGNSGINIDLSAFIKMEVERFNISIKDMVFDKDIKIELPEAAKNAQETPFNGGEATDLMDFYVEEMKISLPEDFEESEAGGYTAVFANEDTAVLVIREDKADLEDYVKDMEEYVQLVLSANESRGVKDVVYETGRPTFEYDYTASNATYRYYTVVYESDEAFWLVQFACAKDNYDAYKPSFVQFADMVVFAH